MRRMRENSPEVPGETSQLDTLKTLLPYFWPADRVDLKVRIIICFGLLILAKLTNVSVPYILRGAVDALSITEPGLLVVPLGLLIAYGLARVSAIAFDNIREGVFAKVVQNAIRRVALVTFRHLHALSLRFHIERRTGGVTRAIDRGTKGIEFMLTFLMFNVIPTLLEIAVVCSLLWYLFDWRFAVVPLVTILAYIYLTLRITEWRITLRRDMNAADNDANTKAVDSLLNFETVKYFGNEEHEAARYDRGLAAYENAAIRSRTSLSSLNIVQSGVISLGASLMMVMSAYGVSSGAMTVGDFVMVNAYLLQLAMPLNFLGFVYREIRQALIDMHTMFELIRQDLEIKDADGASELAVKGAEVRFEDCLFGYDARRPILKGISFTVPAGKKLAIVGSSGAGKSTISRLLFRFYDLDGGKITIDGQDIAAVTQASLRQSIGIVPQDTVLFNDSIYYNIAYGRPSASREEVEAAAKLAKIHDFILSLPDGYESVVGERGLKLSGGEKQRVAIARTVLKDPSILLFDEATSALDSKTEREIQASLNDVSKDRTTLVIAHRLSTVVDADEIIVLEQGQVVERGTHRGLLGQKGHYAEMWQRQLEVAEKSEDVAVPTLKNDLSV
ncbi:ABC transporter ATP-binding protein/permease [Kiloniella laminariae]|uniref:ABC transporter ATP-binding protein/permease n=1 Tax=Kiloniella laminariae TaxID=454162 RepID=A0ABT4LM70_9PROT|nr:ABC transporter ATP-binding protein/permease [Kiloniella laminariae]MCZ4282202.1 ABC transporter ATP-binding protein/permease [Kiloniella laminariae]